MRLVLIATLFGTMAAEPPKDLPRITLTAVAFRSSVQTRSIRLPSTPETSNTQCTASGNTANCSTTTTPAQNNTATLSHADVENTVDSSDGKRLVLTCRASWKGSNCVRLNPGDRFSAAVDANAIWVEVRLHGGRMAWMKTEAREVPIAHYSKDGGTQEQFMKDRYECYREATGPAGASCGMWQACLGARGYTLNPSGQFGPPAGGILPCN